MFSSKLIELYRKLDSGEVRSMNRWVQSPIHNKHQDVIRLFVYLDKCKEITRRTVAKDRVFKYVFPGQPFDNRKLIYVSAYALKQLEEWMAFREMEAELWEKDVKVIQFLRERHLSESLEKKMRQIKKKMQRAEIRNSRFLFYNFKLEEEHYRSISDQKRSIKSNLQGVSDTFDVYFIAEKLRQSCEMLSHKNVERQEYRLTFLDAIFQLLEERPTWKEIPAVKLYFHGYYLLSDGQDFHFKAFKKALEEYGTCFEQEERKGLHLIAINFCIKKLNTGHQEYLRELFGLYQSGLLSDVFIQNNIISRLTYNNIVAVGLKLGEYDWIQFFIDEYKSKLKQDFRLSIYQYNQAKIHYAQGDYESAMRLLLQTEFDEFLPNVDGKRMLLKMYYELEEFDALDALLESFRVYLHRKKEMVYHKTNYVNLINFAKKIVYLNRNDKEAVERLKHQIEQEPIVAEKDWLLYQLNK